MSALSESVVPIGLRTVILVEGVSDKSALDVVASRRGRDLEAERVLIVPMKGATNISHFLGRYGPAGLNVELAGLYDLPEEDCFKRGLERAGLGIDLSRSEMERLGFFGCSLDLEDELIRAVGADAMEQIIEDQDELRSFRIMQRQPAQRGRSHHEQLHRFIGVRSGRKDRYARLLAAAADLCRVPSSLDAVLNHVKAVPGEPGVPPPKRRPRPTQPNGRESSLCN